MVRTWAHSLSTTHIPRLNSTLTLIPTPAGNMSLVAMTVVPQLPQN
jgi:hypothetical protein